MDYNDEVCQCWSVIFHNMFMRFLNFNNNNFYALNNDTSIQ